MHHITGCVCVKCSMFLSFEFYYTIKKLCLCFIYNTRLMLYITAHIIHKYTKDIHNYMVW